MQCVCNQVLADAFYEQPAPAPLSSSIWVTLSSAVTGMNKSMGLEDSLAQFVYKGG